MQKGRVTCLFFGFTSKAATILKVIIPVLCVLLLFAAQITPLSAQLSAARNLTGTWQSSSAGMYYDMDAFGTGIRQADVTGTFTLDITQQDNQITIALFLNPISWVVDPAFWQEYGITGAPTVAGEIDFSGTVSSSNFTADETGSQLTSEELTGTFTTNIITATLSGSAEQTNQNGIVVTLTSSSPIQPTPTSAPSTPVPTSTSSTQPTFDRFMGSVALVKAPAWFTNTCVNAPLSSGQMGSGATVLTGTNSIVSFTYPYDDGTVYLAGNTSAGWIGLTSEPGPENQIIYSVYPSNTAPPQSWGNENWETIAAMVLDAGIAVTFFAAPLGEAAAVAIVVEGGVFLINQGTAYMNELSPHVVLVPSGIIAGENTQYIVNVNDGSTTIQVIDGPVYFIDPTTNNTITVDSNQVLTLPSGAGGFSEQALQSDVSAFNSASVNQWWTQTTPNVLNGTVNAISAYMPLIIVVVIVLSIVAIAGSAVKKRRGNKLQQPGLPSTRILPFLQL